MVGHSAPPRSRCAPLLWSAVLVACFVTAVPASRVRPMNLEELTARAERIFQGRCTAVEPVIDNGPGPERIRVTFQVERAVKGSPPAELTVRVLADPTGMAGEPGAGGTSRFRPGERVILFLYGESESGLTGPVGLGQGKFTILEDKQGRQISVNGFDNEILFRGLSREASTRLGGGPGEWRDRKGIPPDALLRMVEDLAR